MRLGIDVPTKGKKETIRRLRRLKTTIEVSDGGVYWEDRYYSQIHIDTTWTEEQLDDWLYRTKGIEYVGTFVMEQIYGV
jgi:hypothetical protein